MLYKNIQAENYQARVSVLCEVKRFYISLPRL
jgi:hypothetical protein